MRSNIRQNFKFLVVMCAMTVGSVFYQLSLEPAPNEQWIHENLYRLSLYLLISVFCFVGSSVMIILAFRTRRENIVAFSVESVVLLTLFMQDRCVRMIFKHM